MDVFQKIRQNTILLLLLLTGAVFLFLQFLSPLIAPILAAMLFLTIFGPLLKRLQRFHLHRQAGAVLLLLFAGAILAITSWLLVKWGWKELPSLTAQARQFRTKLPDWAGAWLDLGISEVERGASDVQKALLGGALKYAGKAAALGGALATFLIAVILLSKDYDEMMNCLLDRRECHLLLSVICGVIRYVATFVKAQGVIMSVIAGLCALVLTVAGVSQGALFGLLAGVLDALPFIGTGIVLVPLGLFHAAYGRFGIAIACAILYLTCILLREFLEPRLIGKRMGIRPILILISLYVGIRLFGVAGIVKGPLGFVILRETYHHLKNENNKKWATILGKSNE